MNKEKHMKKAQDFIKEDSAYIHCEVKNGETKLAVGGDMRGIIYGAYRTLKRTSELTGMPVELMLNMLQDFADYEEGSNNARDSK